MTWESNGGDEANQARLHIMNEMFPAFHGMNPWYRSHYRAIMVARAAEAKKNGTKRAHSTDVRGSQKKQKPASSPAPTSKGGAENEWETLVDSQHRWSVSGLS